MREPASNLNLYRTRMIQSIVVIGLFSVFEYFLLQELSSPIGFCLADSISFFVLSILFIGLIFNLQKNYHSTHVFNSQNIGSVILFSILLLYLNFIISSFYSIENEVYHQLFWPYTSTKYVIIVLFLFIFLMLFWIDEQKKQEVQFQNFVVNKEKESSKIQLNSLQQQFKPHFLFNSLNSINALTLQNPEEARKMIHLLSEFMRGAIKEDQSKLISLADEIHHISLYSKIEEVRFGDRLQIEFNIDEKFLDLKVPSLILQPIIENAIKYGLYGHTDEVIISINAAMEDSNLIISISNPHEEVTNLTNKGTGYGLKSISKKMQIIYHQFGLLQTMHKNDVFTTTLKIPQL